MRKKPVYFLLCSLLLLSCSYKKKLTAHRITLPPVFSSGMVLQTSHQASLFGYAEPDAILAVKIKDYVKLTRSDNQGFWKVTFPGIQYKKPFTISIEGMDTIINLKNILSGKIYILLGDADYNPLEPVTDHCRDALTGKGSPVRIFQAHADQSPKREFSMVAGKWLPADTALSDQKTCHIIGVLKKAGLNGHETTGIIDLTWPGAGLDCWLPSTSRPDPGYSMAKNLMLNPELLDTITYLKDSCRTAIRNRILRIWYDDTDWRSLDLPANLEERAPPAKRIVYLRKKLFIPPGKVTSDFKVGLGYVKGQAEFYFNEKKMIPVKTNGQTELNLPSALIQTYTNVLAIRFFLSDSLDGIYGPEFVCYNRDSSFITRIAQEWKYNALLETDFPDFSFHIEVPGWLYKEYVEPSRKLECDRVIWYGNYPDLYRTKGKEMALPEMLNDYAFADEKCMICIKPVPVDTIFFPGMQRKMREFIKSVAEEKNITIYRIEDW